MRLMGKRQLAELQPAELVVAILISNIATLPIEDTQLPLFSGLIPILVLVSLDVLMSVLTLKSRTLRRIVSGSPITIISNGKLNQKAMKDLRFSIDDLIIQLRNKDIFDIEEVAFALVETTGNLSVYKKFEAQTTTPEMLNIKQKNTTQLPPTVLISDGELIDVSLAYCKISMPWVLNTLHDQHLTVPDVFLMTCNPDKDFFIIKKDAKTKK